MRLLLDTHVWLWVMSDMGLSRSTFQLCRDAARQEELYLSPMSLWEIALKASRGKLDIPVPVRGWLRNAVHTSRIQLASVTLDVACECAELPTSFHGDPVDRILAATCRVHNLILLTRDEPLLKLAHEGVFQALEA